MKKKREKRSSYLCAAVGVGIGTIFCPATCHPNGSMPNATPIFWSLSLLSYGCHMTNATQGAGLFVVDGGVVIVIVVPVVIIWSSLSLSCCYPHLLPCPCHHCHWLILVLPVVLVVLSSLLLTPLSFSTGQYPCLICSSAVVPALIVLVILSPLLSSNSSWSLLLPSALSGLSFHPVSSCSQWQLGLLWRWWCHWTWACCFGIIVSL